MHTKGTQITAESVFISRFTANSIAPKLQKCWTHKSAKAIKFLLQSTLHFQRTHLQSFSFLRSLV